MKKIIRSLHFISNYFKSPWISQSLPSKNSSLSEEAKGKRLNTKLDGDEFIALLNCSCCDLLAYYKDNRKFKWFSDFDQLKEFVEELGLQGEWVSPGGSAKKFSCDLVTLTWYSNRKSLLLQGKYGELLKKNLLLAIEQSDNHRSNLAHSLPISVCRDECKSVQNSSFVKERNMPSIDEQCPTKTVADKLPQDELSPGSFSNINLDIENRWI